MAGALVFLFTAEVALAQALLPSASQVTFEPRPWSWQPTQRKTAASAATTISLGEIVDQCVTEDMARFDTPGAAVAVAVGGALVYQQGYGVKNLYTGAPVNANTSFRIGSITKQMTTAAVLQQVEAGGVRLDEPVTRSIPELWVPGPYSAGDITVHHLVTHSSGFPDLPLQSSGPTDAGALSRWAAHHGAFGLHAPPGSFFNYSNPNFMLAGLVVERASGLPYHQYMHERVWGPAGLTATTLDPHEVIARGNYSYGHQRSATGTLSIFTPDNYDNWAGAPAGWAFSTAPDLVRWALLLMEGGGAVLSPESAELMQEPVVRSYFTPTARYAYGLFVDDVGGVRLVYHGGNITGWGAILLWAPEESFAVAVLANGRESLTDAAGCVAAAVLDFSLDPPPDYTTDPSTWRRYAGFYAMTDSEGNESTAQVFHHGDGMVVTFRDPGEPDSTSPMQQLFLDTFAVDRDGDGLLDTDFTFVNGSGNPAPERWLRNRRAVGQRAPEARRAGRRTPP